jgi:hypothetical protein
MVELRAFAKTRLKDRGNVARVRTQIVMSLALAVYMTGLADGAQRPRAIDDRALTRVVESYFASQPGYQKGDLITRAQIEKVLAKLEADKVKVPAGASIAKLGLGDDSFLVRELSTSEGRKFMHKIAQEPGTYSRLDRLSTMPRGQSLVHELVREKDGNKLVQYLATTKGGQNMGGMMGQARGGVDLNKRTGRIYTADDLIVAIKDSLSK